MQSLENHLIDIENGIIKLLDPPFDKTKLEPGYIKAYLPGVRENGGQYTHAAMWAIIAYSKLGFGDKAVEYYRMVNPIEHSRTKEAARKYKDAQDKKISDGAAWLTQQLGKLDKQEIAYKYSFTSKPIFKLEVAAQTILEFLLEKFVTSIIYYDTKEKVSSLHERMIALISKDYMRIYKKDSEGKSEKEKLYLRLMLVTDYICGMTDSFAKDLYQELNGIV